MKYYLNMAWRNIWRNKRRTLITAASILFALFFALLMRGFQKGSYGNMVDNVVKAYTGHIQVFQKDYQEDKTIDNSIHYKNELITEIENTTNVLMTVPRLESFALASSGNKTKGVMIVGTVPEKDDQLTQLKKKLVKGSYLANDERGLMVSERLAKYLNTDIGDTVVLISQGFHGIGAADQYLVKGILRFPSPDLDNKTIFMDLGYCQEFYSAPNRLSSISLNIENDKHLDNTVSELQAKLGMEYDVRSWKKILTELVQQIESDNAGGLIMLGILYLIVGFGVFGTVQMMTAERKREFGVMVAVGMQKRRLTGILALEMFFVSLIGIISGILLSIPVLYYGHIKPMVLTGDMAETIINYGMEPIMPTAWEASYFFGQTGMVIMLVFVAVFFPILGVSKLKVNKALRA